MTPSISIAALRRLLPVALALGTAQVAAAQELRLSHAALSAEALSAEEQPGCSESSFANEPSAQECPGVAAVPNSEAVASCGVAFGTVSAAHFLTAPAGAGCEAVTEVRLVAAAEAPGVWAGQPDHGRGVSDARVTVVSTCGSPAGVALVEVVAKLDLAAGAGATALATAVALVSFGGEELLLADGIAGGTSPTAPALQQATHVFSVPLGEELVVQLSAEAFAGVQGGSSSGALVTLRVLEQVEQQGCGWNLPGSLTLAAPCEVGSTVVFAVDNPLGTQAGGPGSMTGLFYTTFGAGQPVADTCGLLVPGLGMGWAALGELHVPLPQGYAPGGTWGGPGAPALVAMAVPDDCSLVGTTVLAQGWIAEPPGLFARTALTQALLVQVRGTF